MGAVSNLEIFAMQRPYRALVAIVLLSAAKLDIDENLVLLNTLVEPLPVSTLKTSFSRTPASTSTCSTRFTT
jgi:hypothetical protein